MQLVSHKGEPQTYRALYDVAHYAGFVAGSGERGYYTNVRSLMKRIRRKFLAVDSGFSEIRNQSRLGYLWRGSVCRVAGLRWCFHVVGDVLQVLTERAHDLMVAVASHHDLVVGSRATTRCGSSKPCSLSRTRMSASASLRISPRMAAASCLGIPRSSVSSGCRRRSGLPRSPRNRRCQSLSFCLPGATPQRAGALRCRSSARSRSGMGNKRDDAI